MRPIILIHPLQQHIVGLQLAYRLKHRIAERVLAGEIISDHAKRPRRNTKRDIRRGQGRGSPRRQIKPAENKQPKSEKSRNDHRAPPRRLKFLYH